MKPFYIFLLVVVSHPMFAQTKETFKDPRDNKTYEVVKINNQTWFARNLDFAMPGAVYPKVEKGDQYGLLYNWEIAQKGCPAGWRLPNEDDWKTLVTALGGKYAAGGKMKGNTPDWKSPNKVHATPSGFNALPAGTISGGVYKAFSESALFWSSEVECTSANTVVLGYAAAFSDKKILPKTDLLSVRCVK